MSERGSGDLKSEREVVTDEMIRGSGAEYSEMCKVRKDEFGPEPESNSSLSDSDIYLISHY
jgi:hypothetical protein